MYLFVCSFGLDWLRSWAEWKLKIKLINWFFSISGDPSPKPPKQHNNPEPNTRSHYCGKIGFMKSWITAAIVPLNQPWPKGKIVERKGFSWNLRNHNCQRSRIYIWHLYNFNHYTYTQCMYFEFVTLMILAQGLHNRGSPLLHDPDFQCLHLCNLGSTFPNVSWWGCLGLLAHDGATIQLCFRSSQLGIKACFDFTLNLENHMQSWTMSIGHVSS